MIKREIRVIAWNFIPLKQCGGFLEIIRWEFVGCCVSGNVEFFPLVFDDNDVVGNDCDPKGKYSVYGVLGSVSPVSLIPCVSENRRGFILEVLCCDCRLCKFKDCVKISDDLGLRRDSHCFSRIEYVYFCGVGSSPYFVFLKLVGSVLLLSGLRKKLVYIENEETRLMFVSTEMTCLSVPKLQQNEGYSFQNDKARINGNWELGMYIGVVRSTYMQGMVVELDEDVWLLLTDESLLLPHSVRVGSILSVRNVHIVNPKFTWGKMLILGACCKTNIRTISFSPLEIGCQPVYRSQSLLGKFMETLVFPARLWTLLLVQCLRKKFSGAFSEKEILGTKHKEGLVQTYARSTLPSSVFQSRHGSFTEFCKHDSCGSGSNINYSSLSLAMPFSYLVNNCERMFIISLLQMNNGIKILEECSQVGHPFREKRLSDQLIRRILPSKDIGVSLLGNLKICPATGRLQYIDGTASVDAVIPDIPSAWDINAIYEIAAVTPTGDAATNHELLIDWCTDWVAFPAALLAAVSFLCAHSAHRNESKGPLPSALDVRHRSNRRGSPDLAEDELVVLGKLTDSDGALGQPLKVVACWRSPIGAYEAWPTRSLRPTIAGHGSQLLKTLGLSGGIDHHLSFLLLPEQLKAAIEPLIGLFHGLLNGLLLSSHCSLQRLQPSLHSGHLFFQEDAATNHELLIDWCTDWVAFPAALLAALSFLCAHRHFTVHPCLSAINSTAKLDPGAFHLLYLTHKFPLQSRFHGDVSGKSRLFAEVMVLPWDLSIGVSNGAVFQTKMPQDDLVIGCHDAFSFKRCKTHLTSSCIDKVGLCNNFEEFENRSCDQPNNLLSLPHKTRITNRFRGASSIQFPCKVTGREIHGQVMDVPAALCFVDGNCDITDMLCSRKVLEFNSENFSKYKFMQIGGIYIMKHCAEKCLCDSHHMGSSMFITSDTKFWSLSFQFGEAMDCSSVSCNDLSYASHSTRKNLNRFCHQNELVLNPCSIADHGSFTDVDLHVAVDATDLSDVDIGFQSLKKLVLNLSLKPTNIFNIQQEVGCGNIMTGLFENQGIYSGIGLPEGKLISLQGIVARLYNSDGYSIDRIPCNRAAHNIHLPKSSIGKECSINLLVLTDCHMLQICGCLSKLDYPVGLGPGTVMARLNHGQRLDLLEQEIAGLPARVAREISTAMDTLKAEIANQITAGQERLRSELRSSQENGTPDNWDNPGPNCFTLTPVSFITINSVRETPSSVKSLFPIPEETIASCLISDLIQCDTGQPRRFHCSVVAVYFVMLERNTNMDKLLSQIQLGSPVVNIPLAGFIMDDGSSQCCCWTHGERAATFLRLYEEIPQAKSGSCWWRSKAASRSRVFSTPSYHIDRILKKHGRLRVKNYGSIHDASCQDIQLSDGSDCTFGGQDENLLKFIMLNACSSTLWNITGHAMDFDAVSMLEKNLLEEHMTLHALQNVWAREVCQVNPLAQAKELFQDL
uniref:CST complex subunit CTC1 n=1 Tax=Chenopodium quinoa TaxID=63459 RepID=A0A803MKN8_CHEQI